MQKMPNGEPVGRVGYLAISQPSMANYHVWNGPMTGHIRDSAKATLLTQSGPWVLIQAHSLKPLKIFFQIGFSNDGMESLNPV
jgi:hypothetical protein